jgi:hypothetical protein
VEDVQIHDFNPGITESGLFWTIPISADTIKVNFAAGEASFQVSDVDVEDYHDVVNALMDGPEVDAEVSWNIRRSHPLGRTKIRNIENNFAGDFVQNVAQLAWTGKTDAATFVSDPAETSVNEFSLLAHKRNGVFFSQA